MTLGIKESLLHFADRLRKANWATNLSTIVGQWFFAPLQFRGALTKTANFLNGHSEK